jgi:hypothetical protein
VYKGYNLSLNVCRAVKEHSQSLEKPDHNFFHKSEVRDEVTQQMVQSVKQETEDPSLKFIADCAVSVVDNKQGLWFLLYDFR